MFLDLDPQLELGVGSNRRHDGCMGTGSMQTEAKEPEVQLDLYLRTRE